MKLREYLKEKCINHKAFARKLDITHATLYNIMLNKDCRLSTALKIERLTGGQVRCVDMGPDNIMNGVCFDEDQLEFNLLEKKSDCKVSGNNV